MLCVCAPLSMLEDLNLLLCEGFFLELMHNLMASLAISIRNGGDLQFFWGDFFVSFESVFLFLKIKKLYEGITLLQTPLLPPL